MNNENDDGGPCPVCNTHAGESMHCHCCDRYVHDECTDLPGHTESCPYWGHGRCRRCADAQMEGKVAPDFRTLAKALVDALPRCTECGEPTIYRGWTRRCERHNWNLPPNKYAAPLRALVAALEETEPE